MRHGHLLAEDSPAALLKEHGTKSLEEVVYKLCLLDTSATSSPNLNNNLITNQLTKFSYKRTYLDSMEKGNGNVSVLNYVSKTSEDCIGPFSCTARRIHRKSSTEHVRSMKNDISRPFRNVK